MKKDWFVVEIDHQVVNFHLCDIPLVRGGDWLCIPLSEEVDCGCLAKGLPLLCEAVFVLPL